MNKLKLQLFKLTISGKGDKPLNLSLILWLFNNNNSNNNNNNIIIIIIIIIIINYWTHSKMWYDVLHHRCNRPEVGFPVINN